MTLENTKICNIFFIPEKFYINVMPSRTWFCITLSDDFKMSDSITPTTSLLPVIQIALPGVKLIISSNTAGVSDTCIETLLLCCPPILQMVFSIRLRIDDPARWTADTWRRCSRRTKHGRIVICISTVLLDDRIGRAYGTMFCPYVCHLSFVT